MQYEYEYLIQHCTWYEYHYNVQVVCELHTSYLVII